MSGKIGIATGVFWNEYGKKSIQRLAEIGYDAVDFSMFSDGHKRLNVFDNGARFVEKEFGEIKKIATDNGVTVAQTHASFSLDFDTDAEFNVVIERLLPELDASAILKSPYVVIHPSMKRQGKNTFEEGLENFEKIIFKAKERLLGTTTQICVENIPVYNKFKYCRTQGACTRADDLNYYAQKFAIGVCLDTGHAHLVGENPAYVARKVGKNLKVMHINDNFGIDDDHTIIYGGHICWKHLALALKEIEYKGDYCAEIDGVLGRVKKTDKEFMFEVAKTNRKFLEFFRSEVEGEN